jgi:F0F1-type ATP synthase assembly protein I
MLRRLMLAQCGVTALLALVLWLFGPNLLHAALLGAGIGVAGNGYAAWRVFAGSRSKNGSVAMFELYRAEFGKLVIIGVLCGCAFIALEDLNFAAFLGGLVSVTSRLWLQRRHIRLSYRNNWEDRFKLRCPATA